MTPDPLARARLDDGIVTLRAFDEGDASRVVAACTDPITREFLLDLPEPYTELSAREWIKGQEEARISGTALTSAVADQADDRVLGALTAAVNPDQRTAELGYWLVPDARGRGYMTRAVRLLSSWLFSEVGLERLEILTEPRNVASAAIAERCGYRREGHLRSHLRDHSGTRRDSLVWGLLPGELR